MPGSTNVAIVTGAAQGVGLCIVKDLAKRGYRVVISDIDVEKGEQAAVEINKAYGEGTAIFIFCDLKQLTDIDSLLSKTVERLGSYSILVNNAGYLRAPFLALSAEDIADTITINLTAPIYASQLAIKYWNENPDVKAQIISVTSSSSFKTYASIAPYGAAKAGAAQLTFCLNTFGPRIRVNAVAPTAIATNFENNKMRVPTDGTGAGYTPEPEMRAMGMNRLQPEDVAAAVIRCVEDETLIGKVLHLDAVKGTTIHSGYQSPYDGERA